MASADVYLKASAAMACVAFAILILSGGPKRRPHQLLAAFLLLLAGNQAAETLRALSPEGPARILWYRVATVCAALDPLLLLAFAETVLRRGGRARRRRLLAPAAVGFILVVAGTRVEHWMQPYERAVAASLSVFTAAIYTMVLSRSLRAAAEAPQERALGPLVAALAIAAVPTWVRAHNDALTLAWFLPLRTEFLATPAAFRVMIATTLALLLVGGALLLRGARRAGAGADSFQRPARASLAFAVALALALNLSLASAAFPGLAPEAWMDIVRATGRGYSPIRWLLFAILVSVAMLRFRFLEMGPAMRRRGARVLVGLALLGLGAFLLPTIQVLVGAPAFSMRPLDVVLLALVAAASQGFHQLVDRVAAVVYGLPKPGLRAFETYHAAVLLAAREGRSLRDDPALESLRDELGIGEEDTALAERLAAAASQPLLVPGQTLAGRYRVRRLVGRGGSGRAFLARDQLVARDVLLKEVLHGGTRSDAAALREARAAGSLAHPNVVVLFDVLRHPESTILVTEYVAGGSLQERLDAQGRLDLEEGLRLLDGVLAGLEAVHRRGLIHRDLKPANVLLAPDGTPKIADFGIARMERGATVGLDEPDFFQGTPEFMAPEQRDGGRATRATDVHAAGRLARAALPEPLPAPIERVVARALAESPAGRWPSAAAMRDALAAAALGVTPGT